MKNPEDRGYQADKSRISTLREIEEVFDKLKREMPVNILKKKGSSGG